MKPNYNIKLLMYQTEYPLRATKQNIPLSERQDFNNNIQLSEQRLNVTYVHAIHTYCNNNVS